MQNDINFHPDDVVIPYGGNPNIKAVGSHTVITQERATELLRCMEDPIYFCENYLKIITLDHGLQPFIPRPYQVNMIKTIIENRYVLAKWPRQSGKTTCSAAAIVYLSLFNKDYTIACLAHKQDQAIEILERVKTYYENLPKWMQVSVRTWNRKSIELESKSIIFAGSTGSGSVRGRTLNMIFADEFSHIQRNMQNDFYTGTFPAISSGKDSKFVACTTPNGYELFWKLWMDAIEGNNDFIPLEIKWNDIPGRNEEWKAKEIARIGEAKWTQEFDSAFLGASATLISSKKLGEIPTLHSIYCDELSVLMKFKEPQKNHQYVLTVDVAEGLGLDYSAFSVIDITQTPYEVVATYNNDVIDPLIYPQEIFNVAKHYNDAYVVVENNQLGQQVVNSLFYEYEYENIFSTNPKARKGMEDITEGGNRKFLGVKQSTKTKKIGTALLKTLIENDELIINDFRIFYQLSRFTKQGSTFKAETGEYDDLVMTLVIFGWLTSTETFKMISNTDLKQTLSKTFQFQEPLGILTYPSEDPSEEILILSEFDKWMMS